MTSPKSIVEKISQRSPTQAATFSGKPPQVHGFDRIAADRPQQIGIEELTDQGYRDDGLDRQGNVLYAQEQPPAQAPEEASDSEQETRHTEQPYVALL